VNDGKRDRAFYCEDLPSKFNPEVERVLVTGASGYIGGLLVPELIERGYNVRVMVRVLSPEHREKWPRAEIFEADALKYDTLKEALKGIHTAYYLIHSLGLGPGRFEEADIKAAENFRKASDENGVERIIYLGGLGDVNAALSSHLRSRLEVAKELERGRVAVTFLRAAAIIGAGSVSYEIIEYLVKRLPLIILPRRASSRCQPIAIRDVIKYLVGVLEKPETSGKYYDIGGKDVLTYEKMLKKMAKALHKRVVFIKSHIPGISFYGYFASLITPVPATLVRSLFEGLKNDVICKDSSIRDVLEFTPLSYKKAVKEALADEMRGSVNTRWSDAYPRGYEFAKKLHEIKKPPSFSTSYSLTTDKSSYSLFTSICRIGGKDGWFNNNWIWRLRGLIDRLFQGYGGWRGRKNYTTLAINDVIDFWRVEDIKHCKRLLLRAEMKLPGMAWLEFLINRSGDKNVLSVTGYYETGTISGKLYWYIFLPFHKIIFYGLIRQIDKRS